MHENGSIKARSPTLLLAMNNLTHSLAPAVADGTLTEEAAFCGLNPEDIDHLMERHPELSLLVRLRSDHADGRFVFTVRDLHAWTKQGVPRLIDDVLWYTDDIRDVLALAAPASLR
jgi:hypothetical protein